MKRIISIILITILLISITGCSQKQGTVTSLDGAGNTATAENTTNEDSISSDDQQMEADMAELEAIGKVDVSEGILYVYVDIPADIIGTDTTQEQLDANAGKTYTSAKLKDDGSATYKMTKAQHKEMLAGIGQSIDEGIQEIVDDDSYNITSVSHNAEYSVFDVNLSTYEAGLNDSFTVLAFYTYGGMYARFSGGDPLNITVNFYDPDGNLLQSGNSSALAE